MARNKFVAALSESVSVTTVEDEDSLVHTVTSINLTTTLRLEAGKMPLTDQRGVVDTYWGKPSVTSGTLNLREVNQATDWQTMLEWAFAKFNEMSERYGRRI